MVDVRQLVHAHFLSDNVLLPTEKTETLDACISG